MNKIVFTLIFLFSIQSFATSVTPPQQPSPFQKCGQKGTIETRINDCSTQCTFKVNDKNFQWQLVTKTRYGYEIWYDETNRKIWSETSPSMSDYMGAISVCEQNSRRDDFKGNIWGRWELASRRDFENSLNTGIKNCTRNFIDQYWTYYSQFDGVIYDGIIDRFYSTDKRKYYKFRCSMYYNSQLNEEKSKLMANE